MPGSPFGLCEEGGSSVAGSDFWPEQVQRSHREHASL